MYEKNFQKEVDSLLVEKFSKKSLEKVHEQYGKIQGTITIPHHNYVSTAKRALERVFPGFVHLKYARETLIAFQYCDNHYHHLTGTSMLEDIISNVRIDFNDYR